MLLPLVQSLLLQRTELVEESGRLSLRRRLSAGDFDEFNRLFQNATINLPNTEVSQTVLSLQLIIDLSNLYCQDVQIGDVELTYNKSSDQTLDLAVSVVGVSMSCFSGRRPKQHSQHRLYAVVGGL
jgi:hypothetical protein